MGYSDTYPALVAKLAAAKGSSGKDASGYPIPIMSAQDMVAVAAMYVPGFANGIRRTCDGVYLASLVDETGVVMVPEVGTISAEDWLAGVPLDDSKPYQRVPPTTNPLAKVAYEPARLHRILLSDETDLISFAWQTAFPYQTALVTGAACMVTYGSGNVGKDQAAVFLSAIRSLGSSIDVLGENPPPGFLDLLPGALKAAANASAKSAGDLAGEIGNVAGDVAGSFLGGLFGSANIVTLAALGVVAWKMKVI